MYTSNLRDRCTYCRIWMAEIRGPCDVPLTVIVYAIAQVAWRSQAFCQASQASARTMIIAIELNIGLVTTKTTSGRQVDEFVMGLGADTVSTGTRLP